MTPSPTRWTAIFLAAATILAAGAAAVWWTGVRAAETELLRTDADAIPARPALAAFAEARARPVYARACAGCHGGRLEGDARLGAPRLAGHVWLYGQGRVSEIEQTLTHGVRSGDPRGRNLASMPAFARPEPYGRYHIPPLGPRDIRDVSLYILNLQGRGGDPAAVARGDAVYHTRGGCYDCHGQDARGDGAIGAPDLRAGRRLYGDGSAASLYDSIAYGRAGACPAWSGRLSAANIRALAVFLHDRAYADGPVA